MKRFILSALFFITLLWIWHLLVLAKIWSPVLLPDPISVWEYLKGAAEDGTLLQASMVTMRRLLACYQARERALVGDQYIRYNGLNG
jgi:NitT/TauT family transport system permease protein